MCVSASRIMSYPATTKDDSETNSSLHSDRTSSSTHSTGSAQLQNASLLHNQWEYKHTEFINKLKSSKDEEQSILLSKHHCDIWTNRYYMLLAQERKLLKKIELLLQEWLNSNKASTSCQQQISDLMKTMTAMESDLQISKIQVVSPALDECDYIQCCSNILQKPETLSVLWDSFLAAKEKQLLILNELHQEEVIIVKDIKEAFPEAVGDHSEGGAHYGIPEAILHLRYPTEEMKQDVIQEFIVLDAQYQHQLSNIDTAYKLISDDRTIKEHLNLLSMIHEEYSVDLPNRKQLIVDRLCRHLPMTKPGHLAGLFAMFETLQHSAEHRKTLVRDWTRHKQDLLAKVQRELEVVMKNDADTIDKTYRKEKQQLLCLQLSKKVSAWRKERSQVLQEQRQLEDQLKEMTLTCARKQKAVKLAEQQKIKEQVHQYRLTKQGQKQQRGAENKILEELQKKEKSKQLRKAKERTDFRAGMLAKQQAVIKHAVKEQLMKHEALLSSLKLKTTNSSPRDPKRVVQPTVSSRAKAAVKLDGDPGLQCSLFKIHTFDEKQLSSDFRFRLANKFQEAGVLESDYAQYVLKELASSKPIKPHLKSSVSLAADVDGGNDKP